MQKKTGLSKGDCKIIASKIRKDIFEPARTYKISIFLCGKAISDKTSLRFRIADILENRLWYSGNYDLVYPEDIFEELLYSSASSDLLSLENLLADSVDVVVVIPESAGSFAELGAFANNENLRIKMLCILDIKYKRDKSFINQGPVKLVKRTNKDGVVYIDETKLGKSTTGLSALFSLERDTEVDKIVSSLRKIKRNNIKKDNRISLLQLDRFLIPAIFLLEPVYKTELSKIVSYAIEDENNSKSSTDAILTVLTKKRFIESTSEGFRLTALGNQEFLSYRNVSHRNKNAKKVLAIDDLRLEILNLKNRNKKLRA
ncbi:retron St85 family effector protein [Pedobacter sp. UC225_61]|uniref:retron St85 family effector protein n=1 Tax=Pedobacter sp. UC225_61 TaxID=3374623 RepID=UPI0037A68C7A